MVRPACFTVFVVFAVFFSATGMGLTQGVSAQTGQQTALTKADQLDAKDIRKLAKIRKLEDLRKELAGTNQLGPEAFRRTEESLTAFLNDPESDDLPRYDLLVQLGDLHMRRQEKDSRLNAIHYLHLASIEDPGRVEAYLRLAQLYSDLGESQEQIKYLNMAHDIVASAARYEQLANLSRKQGDAQKFGYYKSRAADVPQSFEAWYLLAQYYMERGNYFAVLTALRPVAFGKGSYYRDDPYMINQMYSAATLDINTFRYWAPPLYATMIGLTPVQLEKRIEKKFGTFPDVDLAKKIIAYLFSEDLLSYLRSAIDVSAYHEVTDKDSGRPVFRLKPVSLGWGSPKSPLKFDKDLGTLLPEFFVRASVSPSPTDTIEEQSKKEEQLKNLKQRISQLKKTADEKFGNMKDPEQKAKALFDWLKQDVLKNYAVVEGIPAENVLDPEKKKYLCLTGTIMYTFLGRHLGLDVVGCLAPGHAYCRFNNNGRSIVVETTSSSGFDIPESQLYKGDGKHGGILFPEKAEGPVSPWELVSCQFMNVAYVQPRLLIFEKPQYKELALKAFEKLPQPVVNEIKKVREAFERQERGDDKFKWEGDFSARDCLETWFLTPLGTVPQLGMDMGKLIELQLIQVMIELDPNFRKDVLAKYEEGLEVLARALQMEPFSARFRGGYVRMLQLAQNVDIGPQKTKMETWTVQLSEAKKELSQAIQDLKKTSTVDQQERTGGKSLAETQTDVRTRAEAKIEKYFSVGDRAAREAVEFGSPLISSLERRRAAMKYCPPIPELRQEYLRFVNALYRHLSNVESFCDSLLKLPGAPEHITRTKGDVAALRDKVSALAWGMD
jgi:tetratricopeptide (TPR) repeat protein